MGARLGDVALASGVVEIAVESGEGGESAPGIGDALDVVGGLGGLVGSPVVGDGFGDAAELDDGEFGGEPALEGVDPATELGKRSWDCLGGGEFTWMNGMDRIRYWTRMAAIF